MLTQSIVPCAPKVPLQWKPTRAPNSSAPFSIGDLVRDPFTETVHAISCVYWGVYGEGFEGWMVTTTDGVNMSAEGLMPWIDNPRYPGVEPRRDPEPYVESIQPAGMSPEFVRDIKWAAAIGGVATLGAAGLGAKRDTTSAVAFGVLGLLLGGLGSAMIGGTVVSARAASRMA